MTTNSYPDPSSDNDDRRIHRIFNPYEHIEIAGIYPAHGLSYNLPVSPEILFEEEGLSDRRSWGYNLSFFSGSGYLAGSVFGGAKGTVAGIRAAEPGDSLKLRLNRVLNSSGQVGRRYGNSLGVLGLIFGGLESGVSYATGKDGVWTSVAAGLGTGAIYKAASGPRSAAIAGAIGGVAAALSVAGKHLAKRYVPI
ncbi:hypothetical protein J5N97_014710 [Dioscorea zingiberensis]|uniref:Uncharacterized protein n=1 Tax=Dioscorea zingiberensis TaxID=325984 RepID=A0A9D5CSY3_9LILI|nr:hypothetical protein J5N97_014710 [Dioscorea zingiberensis]